MMQYCTSRGYRWNRGRVCNYDDRKSKEIGMENTNFTNSSGINAPDNLSLDILIMSNYLIKNYPNYYKYYKKLFTWDRTGGDPIKQGNRILSL